MELSSLFLNNDDFYFSNDVKNDNDNDTVLMVKIL